MGVGKGWIAGIDFGGEDGRVNKGQRRLYWRFNWTVKMNFKEI